MRLLWMGVAALLTLIAFPTSGRAQPNFANPNDVFLFYRQQQNQRALQTQQQQFNDFQQQAASRQAQSASDRGSLDARVRFLEELDPDAPLGIGRSRAARRIVPRFNDTAGYYSRQPNL